MRITFVQPGLIPWPIGGLKIVYEYANHLVALGHHVTVVHPRTLYAPVTLLERIKGYLWPYKLHFRPAPLIPWFPIDPKVRMLLVSDLRERFIPEGDAIFATAYRTAEYVANYTLSRGAKFYLIQHHEIWDAEPDLVNASWKLSMHKVVIARWLRELAASMGEQQQTTYIPNGIDFDAFPKTQEIASRPLRVGMLYHRPEYDWKGTADGLMALQEVKRQFPLMEAVLFGVNERGPDIPAWIEYVQNPSSKKLSELYNSCSTFLHPSWAEGWGLPPAEAMASGCALVAAANGGVSDFATDGHTALMAPVRQPTLLAARLAECLMNGEMRQRIAENGYRHIRTYTWERATQSMHSLLVTKTTPNRNQVNVIKREY